MTTQEDWNEVRGALFAFAMFVFGTLAASWWAASSEWIASVGL